MTTIKTIAAGACRTGARAVFGIAISLLLLACSALPQPPVRSAVYDFGPGPASAVQGARQPAIVLSSVATGGVPVNDNALYYRLAYANAQQLRPYSLARWSQSPATLLAQTLRTRLGQERPVLSPGAPLVGAAADEPELLKVELEEFSQVFDAPQASHALVRARASLFASAAGDTRLRAQQLFVVQRPAATPDAAGGAQALAAAAAQLADELAAWLAGLPAPAAPGSGAGR
ncbi:ABC-type transport auxiliary lipoprotein family protein [Comamonas sp. NLF-1-9]|uniref:ABC-type transport auxiliary lipoprotein family protein n=1 Tax=Comamonas sp. NLF-1-9 TaxID=2853163 RepID=UPI001C43C3C9|nr:ABC-type transport auxiliary lipoprotein family protein [Comamonas sp. NLF-1-9]QXL83702.1 membrane integrity-associated transporter subunit PqiC [Comamonas sp. NLF-1-9]